MQNKITQWIIGIALIAAGTYVSWLLTPGDYVQIVAAISGLLCVWLVARGNILNYPIGLVNIIALIITFYGVQLYADFTLNIVFFVLNIYGWMYWLKNRGSLKVRETQNITKKELIVSLIVIVIGTPVWGYIFDNFFGAALAYPDSFVMVASLVAQWFMSRKTLQHWYFWIAVDLVAIPIYFAKDLPLIALLYIVYLGICVNGLLSWKKEMKEKAQA
ncbi:MAG: nicotinamide mononucleotide transporter PnuC [Bacillales bacterium]|jgi:nicotinamide mononucleotide transporter|nr:nicotinamide mononucleotide transporter PnuC [Bacillales bacterium]